MTNYLVYHIASGQAFFSGVALIVLAVIVPQSHGSRWLALSRTVAGFLGLSLIVLSATPLPVWCYLVAGAISLTWIMSGYSLWLRSHSPVQWFRCAMLSACVICVLLEIPYHITPALPRLEYPTIDVIGDSISAGMNAEAENWPGILARRHHVIVNDLSRSGATVASATKEQAGRLYVPGALVIAEIGGNDVLSDTTPESFELGLDALLSRLREGNRTVVMLELPLPPFYNKFGAAQRRSARRHGVVLIPKRVLLGVMTTDGATLDSVHLTPSGHELMAEVIWEVIREAAGPKH